MNTQNSKEKANRKHRVLRIVAFLALLVTSLTTIPGGESTQAKSLPERSDAPNVATGTAFTYQGSLKDGGNPANGQYDLQFKLYNALSAGTQVGSTLTQLNQTVTNGLFTAQLDFGANAFGGDARWLEIAVRSAGIGSYITLSPRQPLTAVPYAMSLATGSNGSAINGAVSGPALTVTNTNGFGIAGVSSGSNSIGVYGVANNGASASGIYGQSSTGTGVAGFSTASGSSVHAIYGLASGTDAIAVHGISHNGSSSKGVYGQSANGSGVYGDSASGYGVYGSSNYIGVFGQGTSRGLFGSSTNGEGVWGQSTNGPGVYGQSSTGFGISGLSSANNGIGIYGQANTGSGAAGVYGQSSTGTGVAGFSTASGSSVHAIYGLASGTDAIAVHGISHNGSSSKGVYGQSANGSGVYGDSASGRGVTGSSTNGFGVKGESQSSAGVVGTSLASGGYGVWGEAASGRGVYGTGGNCGVCGDSSSGYGVDAHSNTNYGLVASSNGTAALRATVPSGIAAYFEGDIVVTGNCSGCFGPSQIDHPLDPENKYLTQVPIQSSEMKNVYDGNVTTDSKGEAVVVLPDWFEALNTDFRYQLTIVGDQFAQARVSSKIKDNRFTVKTDKPNIDVSWQVTGVRHDPYAQAYPIQLEVEKSKEDQGKYLYPEAYGQPNSKGIGYADWQKTQQDFLRPQEQPKP